MSVLKNCRRCGAGMSLKPSAVDKVTYCSKACMAEDYRERMTGERNPNYRAAGWQTCSWCGASFQDYGPPRKYCSRVCRDADPATAERARRNGRMTATCRVRTAKPRACKKCGDQVGHNRLLCDPCFTATRRVLPSCRVCGVTLPTYRRRFCPACRAAGKHRVAPPVSICSACGVTVPKYGRKFCDDCWRATMALGRITGRKTDANQAEIFGGLRELGVSILDTSAVGRGCPDGIAGVDGVNVLIEIKNPASRGKLNALQRDWHASWRGRPVVVAYTLTEAIHGIEAQIGRPLLSRER